MRARLLSIFQRSIRKVLLCFDERTEVLSGAPVEAREHLGPDRRREEDGGREGARDTGRASCRSSGPWPQTPSHLPPHQPAPAH